MRCIHCGLPLSPTRATDQCPRCGFALNAVQGVQPQQQSGQASWEGGGAGQRNLWGQGNAPAAGAYTPFSQHNQATLQASRMGGPGDGPPQAPLVPRSPYATPRSKVRPRLLFMAAALCVFLASLLLGLVYILGSTNNNSPANQSGTTPNSASTNATATAASSAPTATQAAASPTSTPYPGQQYIDHAQMAQGVDPHTLQAENPTTTFPVGSRMYVVFQLHPPGQGGAFCIYWYQNGKQVTTPYAYPVRPTSQKSYSYATYGQAGESYVDIYWASTTRCTDQLLAQHVTFTVTA